MRYAAAYLLAILGGNASPDVAAIAKILGSVGIECDEKRAQKVIDACKGRDVNEIIAGGMEKLNDVQLGNASLATVPVNTVEVEITSVPSPASPSTPSTPGSCTFDLDLFS